MVDVHRPVRAPEPADLRRATKIVSTYLEPTPLIRSDAGADTQLKLECWQPTGSFKVRGAFAALTAASRAAGVVTASTGNHALAVAYAATRLGLDATVVVPTTASTAKVEALRRLGVRLVSHGEGFDAAEAHALDLARDGATYVSAYNDTHVIAGQASIGAELENQISGPVTVVVPVGGGGLAAGLTLWAAGHPGARVIGVEAQASRAVSTTMAIGRPTTVPIGPTLAEALAGNLEPGAIAPAILAAHATPVVAVSEAEIRQGMRYLAQSHGLAVEGAGATAIAALLAGKIDATGRIVAVVTGRNVALPTFAAAITDEIGDQE